MVAALLFFGTLLLLIGTPGFIVAAQSATISMKAWMRVRSCP